MLSDIVSSDALQKFRESIYADNVVVREEEGQIGGFVFSVQRTAEINLSANITDYYVEDNRAVNDHIAVQPVKVTLSGYVGERVMNRNTFVEKFLQGINSRLTPVVDLYPKLTNYTQQIYNSIDLGIQEAKNIFRKVDTIFSVSLMATQGDSKQMQAYKYFEALLKNRQLVSVVTPYKVFENMAVETVHAFQREQSTMVSDITVTLKQITFSNTRYVPFVNPASGSYNYDQAAMPFNSNNISYVDNEMFVGANGPKFI
jgi:hypothetical protein